MLELLPKIMDWAETLLLATGALVYAATIVTRMTSSKSDDAVTSKAKSLWNKALSYAPTLGLNPRTKQLQEAFDALEE